MSRSCYKACTPVVAVFARPLHDSVTQSNSAFQSCESSRLDSQKL
jgi:hypothetical protein